MNENEKYDIGDIDQRLILALETIRYAYIERSQLYGALAMLMINTNTIKFDVSYDDFKYVGKNYHVAFKPGSDDNTISIELINHEENENTKEEKEEDSEDKLDNG